LKRPLAIKLYHADNFMHSKITLHKFLVMHSTVIALQIC
jgi:hypothetical protein